MAAIGGINPANAAEVVAAGADMIAVITALFDAPDIAAAAGRFDFILTTVNVKLDWNRYLSTLKPKGRLHFVGATLEPLDLNVFSLIMAQRSVSGSPVGSPATIKKMLDFALQHDIKPVVETFKFHQINDAIAHLESGKARYRIVLER